MAKNVICLWYDGAAEEAAKFYAKTFPNSAVTAIHHGPRRLSGWQEGQVLTVEFTVVGVPCVGLNGGPMFKHSEAFSFQIVTEDQAETDRYWNAIVGNGGAESQCGWCKDKWGLSWQITPRVLLEATTDPDQAAAKRAFDAMMKMKKIDIATIEAARRGRSSRRGGQRSQPQTADVSLQGREELVEVGVELGVMSHHVADAAVECELLVPA